MFTRLYLQHTRTLLQINVSINPRKTTRAKGTLFFNVIKMYSNTAECEESVRKLFLGW